MSTRFTISKGSWSSTQDFPDENPGHVTFENLEPGTNYSLTAELYNGDNVIDTDTKTFKTTIEYVTDKFYLQNETAEENIFTLTKTGTPTTTDLAYSLDDGTTWTTFDLTQATNTVTMPANGKVHLRSSTGFSKDSSNNLNITCSKNFSVYGNIQCLHNYTDLTTLSVGAREFSKLFYNATTLISAKYMYLPATTLAASCYSYMFNSCTSLTTAPELPATTLAGNCYQGMFQGCTSLTTAPELPATTLATKCYEYMLDGCTSLTVAPELPATTLADYCYYGMFEDCTSITEAPELPATTLAEYCYESMFRRCTSLTAAPELPATTLAYSCCRGMFEGCTSITTAPTELPATGLTDYCYSMMFFGCTSLTTAPELPAKTLRLKCYRNMFQDCTSLTTAPELPAKTTAQDCYTRMFYGCTSLKNAIVYATTLTTTCFSEMFSGCTNLQSVTTHVTNWNTSNTNNWLYGAGTNATNPTVYCTSNVLIPSDSDSGIPTGWTRADLVTN